MENKVLYITSSGKLSRKDNTLLFENENTKKVIPIVGIEQIYALGEISVNSKLLQYLSENKISLHFFNYYGYYVGSYYPKESYVSGKLLVEQVKHYENLEKRLILAKDIVKQIGNNQIYLLKHYQKHGKNVANDIKLIKNKLNEMNFAKAPNEVLALEGALWGFFYGSFKKFLKEDFILNKRVKRPPDNPINALISFGNSILYTYTLGKIYHTQLNPTISYLHEVSEKRFSLVLDLAETFKLVIVFPVIFNLVNRGTLKVKEHFETKLNYSLLNERGRKVFLQAWNEKIQSTIQHPKLKRKISYGSLIKLDAYKLIKHLIGEEEFVPFDLEDKI